MKSKFYSLFKITLLFAVLVLTSCKKTTDTTPPTPTGYIGIHIHTNLDSTEVDSGDVVSISGRKAMLSVAQFYAYNFVIRKTDGSSVTLDKYILKTIGTEMYVLGQLPAGNYNSVSFSVGVGSSYNSLNPSTFASSDPLSPQSPAMWFGSTSQGYIFMNVQGLADTSAAQTAPVSQYQPFSYQLGTAAMLKTVTLPNMDAPLSITTSSSAANPALVHLTCDYAKLLQGINLKTQPAATPFSNSALATQMAGSISGMFSYEM
jgi:hypothetical protein